MMSKLCWLKKIQEKKLSRFILGTGADDKQHYVVHTEYPFFIALVSTNLNLDDDSFALQADGITFYEFTFFEEPPESYEDLQTLVSIAAEAYKEMQNKDKQWAH